MKTVSDLILWLNSPDHIKCTLVDISDVVINTQTNETAQISLSSTAFNDNTIAYIPIINGGLSFSESLSVDGSISSGFGNLELTNTGGKYDYFLSYVWKRRPIKIYLGDISWPKSDFALIFDGIIDDLIATDETTLNISLFDKLQRLNDSITEVNLTSTNYSQKTEQTLLPLLFGECFNVQPLLVDNGSSASGGQVYMYHHGSANGIIEVRDNGRPIEVIEDISTGTFTLKSAPIGTITCSAQGYAPTYTNTVPGIIKLLVQYYGLEYNRFLPTEINFDSFSNLSKVGIYLKDRTNVLDACSQLASSINSGLVCPSISIDSSGNISASKLKLVELKVPAGTPKYTFTDASMLVGTLSVSQTFPIRTVLKLAYCKNYTVQTSVAAALNPTINFSQEYLFADSTDPVLQELYKDNGTVNPEETLLIVESEATAELTKRKNLWSTQRYLITATYLPEYIFVQLGDIVSIQSSRFNLSTAKLGIVFSITRNWITGMVDIGVLV
jgi:hypothetical protein